MDESARLLASFQEPELQALWLTAFAPGDRLRHLPVGSGASLPLLVRPGRWPRVLASPTNEVLPLYELPGAGSPAELGQALRRERGWERIDLDLLREGSATWRQLAALRRAGWPIELRPWQVTTVVDLRAGAAAYLAGRPPRLRKGLRGHEQRLRRQGEVRLVEVGGRSDWEVWFAQALRIEAAGWKGAAGSAIAQSARLTGYYRELFRRLRSRGQFRLYALLVGGRMVAFDTVALMGETAYSLKCSFDPAFAKGGPGGVLWQQEVAALAAEPGIVRVDLGYPPSEWKRRWGSGSETLWRARLYPPTPGGRIRLALRQAARALRDLWRDDE